MVEKKGEKWKKKKNHGKHCRREMLLSKFDM
jgi:hypothetical protein